MSVDGFPPAAGVASVLETAAASVVAGDAVGRTWVGWVRRFVGWPAAKLIAMSSATPLRERRAEARRKSTDSSVNPPSVCPSSRRKERRSRVSMNPAAGTPRYDVSALSLMVSAIFSAVSAVSAAWRASAAAISSGVG